MTAAGVSRSQGLLLLTGCVRLALFTLVSGLLGRGLNPGDFGFVTLVSGLLLVAQEVLDLGSSAAATRAIAREPASEIPVLCALLGLRRWIALGLAALVLALAQAVGEPDQRHALTAVAVVVFTLHLNAYYVVFQVRLAYGRASLLAGAGYVLFVAACVLALRLQAGGAAVALIVAMRELLLVLGARALARSLLGTALQASWFDPGICRLLGAGWLIGSAGVLYRVLAQSPVLMLWASGPAFALGSFGAARRIVQPFGDAAWSYATPLLANLSAENRSPDLSRSVTQQTRFMLGFAASAAVAGWILAPSLLRLLYGERYGEGPNMAVAALHWLVAAMAFAVVTPILAMSSIAAGREAALARAGAIGLVGAVGLGAALLHPGEAGSAAAALCFGEALVFAALFFPAWRRAELQLSAAWLFDLLPAVALAVALTGLRPPFGLALAPIWLAAVVVFLLRRTRSGSVAPCAAPAAGEESQ